MTVTELSEALDELQTLPAHEELPKLREVIGALAQKCVEAADLRFPGLGRIVERCIQREAELARTERRVSA